MEEIGLIKDLAVVMLIAGITGWICQKVQLSVVVGYLIAGIVIGPSTPLELVTDQGRIQLLAQLGLVFLMFFVGMGLSIQRLKRMGVQMVAAIVIGAILMFSFCRLAGDALGWPPLQSLYLAGMLMVSSSAIIAKVLEETNATHQRAGQLAMGVSVLEDAVAVVMLTLLGSFAMAGGSQQGNATMGNILGLLTAFVTLAVIGGLLFVPRFLARVSKSAAPEIRTLLMIGLLFGLAWVAIKAGYSAALGAFLLGTIVGETPQKPHIERAFEGLRDMFSAMFFVAIGIMIDVNLLLESWALILGFTVFTIIARATAVTVGLTAAGHETKDAVKAGLCVTTIGEFSYVIAHLGISPAVGLPQYLYPMAVGISLGTTLAAPLLIRKSGVLAGAIVKLEPPLLRRALDQYSRMLESIGRFSEANALWRLMRKRVIHVAIEVAVVSGVLIFAESAFQAMLPHLPFMMAPLAQRAVFFVLLGIVILPALIAIWRNISALTLVCAELATSKAGGSFSTQMVFHRTLRTVAAVAIGLWLYSLLPHVTGLGSWMLAVVAVVAIIAGFLWRRFVRFHSHIEGRINESLESSKSDKSGPPTEITQPAEDWDLSIVDIVLPENSMHAGKTIGTLDVRKNFGCSIVGIERQGYPIDYPGPEVKLYPQDKLLVMGTPDQIDLAGPFLAQTADSESADSLSEWALETVELPGESSRLGSTLEDLSLRNSTGVLIAGIQRGSERILSPGGKETLKRGDQLLVLGNSIQLSKLRAWLEAE